MNEIQFKLEADGKGVFFIENNNERQAEMVVGIDQKNITVFHTQVSEALKGQSNGTQLLNTMVEYARTNHLKVIPLCPFVNAQFKRHPEKFEDIWNQNWH